MDEANHSQTLPRVVAPLWKVKPQPQVHHYYISDYGSMGPVVEFGQDSSVQISNSKENGDFSYLAKAPAIPLLPPNSKKCLIANQHKEISYNSVKWMKMMNTYRSLLRKKPVKRNLKEVCKKLSKKQDVELELPTFMYYLASKLPNGLTPDGRNANEMFYHNGGSVLFQTAPNSPKDGILLYSARKKLNTLVITPVNIQTEEDSQHPWLKPNLDASSSLQLSSKLYGITCQKLCNRIFCGLRQTKTVNIGTLKCRRKKASFELLRDVEKKKEFTDLALSPYLEGDFICATVEGKVIFMNVETGSTSQVVTSLSSSTRTYKRHCCQFAAHPRNIVISNETDLILKDLRLGGHSDLLLYNSWSSEMAYNGESLHVVKCSSVNSYLHYVATSYSFHLIDQRFPGHPVLTWRHQLMSQPTCCSVLPLSTESSSNHIYELAALASYNSKEISLFHSSHDSVCRSRSLNAPLHISSSGNFVQLLLEGCYDVDPLVDHRTSAAICGVHCFAPDPNHVIVLHQTAFGDVFSQQFENVPVSEREMWQSSHSRQHPHCTKYTLNDEVAKYALTWTRNAMNLMTFKDKHETEGNFVDASKLFKAMMEKNPHSHKCPLCCECSSSDVNDKEDNGVDPTEICPSCGLQLQFSKKLADKDGHRDILAGRLPESLSGKGPVPTAMPLRAEEPHMIKCDNDYMQQFLNVWQEDPEGDIRDTEDVLSCISATDSQYSQRIQQGNTSNVWNYLQSNTFPCEENYLPIYNVGSDTRTTPSLSQEIVEVRPGVDIHMNINQTALENWVGTLPSTTNATRRSSATKRNVTNTRRRLDGF